MTKAQYINIVDFTIGAMIDLYKEDESYSIVADLKYYYDTKIKTDRIITVDEFVSILLNKCNEKGLRIADLKWI